MLCFVVQCNCRYTNGSFHCAVDLRFLCVHFHCRRSVYKVVKWQSLSGGHLCIPTFSVTTFTPYACYLLVVSTVMYSDVN